MFLVVHAAVGAIAGNVVASPEIAFILGFVSHFFLDMIPHGDDGMLEDYQNGKDRRLALFKVGADVLATVVLIAAFYVGQDFISPLNVAMGIAGGLLPDLLVGIHEMTRVKKRHWFSRHLLEFSKFHVANHHFLIGKTRSKRDVSMRWGLALQGASLLLLASVII